MHFSLRASFGTFVAITKNFVCIRWVDIQAPDEGFKSARPGFDVVRRQTLKRAWVPLTKIIRFVFKSPCKESEIDRVKTPKAQISSAMIVQKLTGT